MNPVDVKSSSHINSSKEINDEDSKFKIGDIARILKYKNFFGYVPSWSEKVFASKKVKNTVAWLYVISDLKGKEIVEKFYEKNCKKQIKKSLELKK